MRINEPVDVRTGARVVTVTPVTLEGYWDVPSQGDAWIHWVANDGEVPVLVWFLASPDGTNPDMDTLDSVTCDPHCSVSVQCERALRRYWATRARAESGTAAIRWGTTLIRGS